MKPRILPFYRSQKFGALRIGFRYFQFQGEQLDRCRCNLLRNVYIDPG